MLGMSCNQTVQKSDNPAISYNEKKDCLSVSEYREYGKASPSTINTGIGDLSFTKGGFAGGYPGFETIDKLKTNLNFRKLYVTS